MNGISQLIFTHALFGTFNHFCSLKIVPPFMISISNPYLRTILSLRPAANLMHGQTPASGSILEKINIPVRGNASVSCLPTARRRWHYPVYHPLFAIGCWQHVFAVGLVISSHIKHCILRSDSAEKNQAWLFLLRLSLGQVFSPHTLGDSRLQPKTYSCAN